MDQRKKYFITGTDTDVGKTWVACRLLEKYNKEGLSTLGLKPVAAGCEETAEGLRNEDALKLMAASSVALPYEQVNPVTLKEAIAPHLAAAHENKTLGADRLAGYVRGAMMTPADVTLVEGAGGWMVPLSPRESMADLAKILGLPVILVVEIKLGCINHALLTARAIRMDGLELAGWVANKLDENDSVAMENVYTLENLLGVERILL